MRLANTIVPDLEAMLDNAADGLTGSEVVKDSDSYNMGYYQGVYESTLNFMKVLGWDVRIELDRGMHRIIPND